MSYALFDTATKAITFNYQTFLNEGMSITSNLMIGTTSTLPIDSISVYNTQLARKASILLYEENQKTKDIGIYMVASNVRSFDIGLYGASNNSNAFIHARNTDLTIATNNLERMRVRWNGNIGIGTSIPLQPVHISVQTVFTGNLGVGTTLPQAKLDILGTTLLSGNLGIGTTIPRSMVDIQGNTAVYGNIGIGTNDPSFPLDLQGSMIVSGNIGIGTTIPNYPIHVTGDVYTSGSVLMNTLHRSLLSYNTTVTVGGGVCGTGVWVNRPVNTITYNDIPNLGITTASSYFTLPKGTYKCAVRASAYNCGYNRLRLVRGGITEIAYGMSHYAASNIEVEAYLDTIFTQSTSSENYNVQHWTEFSSIDGLGKPRGTGLISADNIYLMVDLQKLN